MIKIYSDGGARGNPGPASCAFLAIAGKGKILWKDSKFLGSTTNNIAEYNGVLLAIEWLIKADQLNHLDKNICFYLDSELVVKQLQNIYKIRNTKLKELFLSIKKIEQQLPIKIIYKNIPREKNKLADYLVNEKLDEESSK